MEKIIEQLRGLIAQVEAGKLTQDEADVKAGKLYAEADGKPDKEIKSWVTELRELTEIFADKGTFENVKFREEIEAGVANAADLFNTFANISESKRQIRAGEEAANALVEPAIPAPRSKSEELKGALEDARRDKFGRPPELDPILQRNLDLLREGMGVARTGSAGQASTYGVLGQNAINQARRANIAAIPAIEGVRRSRTDEYNKLLGASVGEDASIYRDNLLNANMLNNRYLKEAEAAGSAIGSGRYNLALSRQGLGQGLGSLVKPAFGAIGQALKGKQSVTIGMNTLDSLNTEAGDFSRSIEASLYGKFSDGSDYNLSSLYPIPQTRFTNRIPKPFSNYKY